MNIRSLEPSDCDTLYQMDRKCFPPAVAFPRRVFEYCLTSENCLGLGIEKDERLIGFIIAQATGHFTATILTLEVEQEFRGQGIATTLLREMEKLLRTAGFRLLTLQVQQTNKPALALYRKLGYHNEKILRDYYGKNKNAVHMEKSLAARTSRKR